MQYEQQLADQAKNFQVERDLVSKQQEANDRRAAELETTAKRQEQAVALAVQDGIAKELVGERKKITEQESVRARQRVEDELRAERESAKHQQDRITNLTQKLTIAQATEANLLKKERALEDRERELQLDLQKGIAEGLAEARSQASRGG